MNMKNIEINKDTLSKIILGVLIFGGICYIYAAYFWIPLSKKISELEKKNSEMELNIIKAKNVIAKYNNLQKKLEELKVQKEELKRKIPADKNISELFRLVKKIADKNSVVINSINPLSTVAENYYFRISYSMSVKGSYHNIGNFIGELASEERILNVENIVISGEESVVNFILVSYQYMEGK